MIDQKTDYYACKICKKPRNWYKTNSEIGIEHIRYFDPIESNKKDAKYYYDIHHNIWHRPDRSFIQYQAKLSVSNGKIKKTVINKNVDLNQPTTIN